MKKDLTKYYVKVTPKDAIKIQNLYNRFGEKKDLDYINWAFSAGATNYSLIEGKYRLCNDFRVRGKKKISLKTLTNYIAYNKQVEQSFSEPIELRKLTEANTALAKENESLKNISSKQRVVSDILNDKINQQGETIKKLESKILAKDIVMAILAFVLTLSFIVITQKM